MRYFPFTSSWFPIVGQASVAREQGWQKDVCIVYIQYTSTPSFSSALNSGVATTLLGSWYIKLNFRMMIVSHLVDT